MSMITHEELLAEWERDAGFDKTALDDDALSIPKLHHKYLTHVMNIKSKKIAYTTKLESIRKDKELYYSGQATSDAYRDKPFDLKLKTKSGVSKHVDTDPEVVGLIQKIEYMDVLLDGLSHIMTQIQWRNTTIKNAIDWIKFQNGGL